MSSVSNLRPIETAPKDGTFVLVLGDSGYATTPLRAEVCHYAGGYATHGRSGWRTHANDAFEDSGKPPTHWMPLPEMSDEQI